LLVSVRSGAEAEAALAGGVDLIDIKEPANGSLGRADDRVIADILRQVADRRPVSAAMGELLAFHAPSFAVHPSLVYLKWGLSQCRSHPWQDWLRDRIGTIETFAESPQVVAVAYADATLADAPPVPDVVDFACANRGRVLLIDTFVKDNGKNLLDWLSVEQLAAIHRQCRAANVRLALAGSLREGDIAELLPLQPDWLAVRGMVCEQGRDSAICAEKVRRLAQQIQRADVFLHGS
jgi:uncharacterized protein (UPF0264 family)